MPKGRHMSQGDLVVCAGVRGIQQVRRSRSNSRTTGRGHGRSRVKECMAEAECLAAKLYAYQKTENNRKVDSNAAKPGQPHPVVELRKPSPESAPEPAEPAQAITAKEEDIDRSYQSDFRFKPSVNTWKFCRRGLKTAKLQQRIASHDDDAAKPDSGSASTTKPFQQYYQNHFIGSSIDADLMEQLFPSNHGASVIDAAKKTVDPQEPSKEELCAKLRADMASAAMDGRLGQILEKVQRDSTHESTLSECPFQSARKHLQRNMPTANEDGSLGSTFDQAQQTEACRVQLRDSLSAAAADGRLQNMLAQTQESSMKNAALEEFRVNMRQSLSAAALDGSLRAILQQAKQEPKQDQAPKKSNEEDSFEKLRMKLRQNFSEALSDGRLGTSLELRKPETKQENSLEGSLRKKLQQGFSEARDSGSLGTILQQAKQESRPDQAKEETKEETPFEKLRMKLRQNFSKALSDGRLGTFFEQRKPETKQETSLDDNLRKKLQQGFSEAAAGGQLGALFKQAKPVPAQEPSLEMLRAKLRRDLTAVADDGSLCSLLTRATQDSQASVAPSKELPGFRFKPSVGTWSMQRPFPVEDEPASSASPVQEALVVTSECMGKEQCNVQDVAEATAKPAWNQRPSVGTWLSVPRPPQAEIEAPAAPKPEPQQCLWPKPSPSEKMLLQTPALIGPSFWSCGLRPMAFVR